MSRIIGTGESAALVAGGLDSPEAEARNAAARELVRYLYIHGMPFKGYDPLVGALRALHPRAADHYEASRDPHATLCEFWPDRLG